jgi:hypothetical protein
MFEEHEVKLHTKIQVPTPIELLYFKKPGTNLERIDYILVGTTLFIRGDFGEAVYQWRGSDVDGLKWIADIKDYVYFNRKCVAVPVSEADCSGRFLLWDSVEYLRRLKDYYGDDIFAEAVEAEITIYSEHENEVRDWYERLEYENEELHDKLSDKDFEAIDGYTVHPWCQYHLDGLREAFKRLESSAENERSTECKTTDPNEMTESTT